MVDVGEKPVTQRTARARARIRVPADLLRLLRRTGENRKGPILHTCVLAAIAAAKRTADIIPLCHPLPLDALEVQPELKTRPPEVIFHVTARTSGKTGVEMEALTGAAAAALTFYDMVKSGWRALSLGPIELVEKSGGRSGHFCRAES